MPTALHVGIVDTKGQEDVFRKLVGDNYDDFISNTSTVFYDEVLMDGEKVKAGSSHVTGNPGTCFYIIFSTHIYAAILGDDDSIFYYTNDKNYASRIPGPMKEWSQKRNKIVYIYSG
jgi:hypothetical protein